MKELCRVLFVSESGYYRWLRNSDKPSSRELLSVEIKNILKEHQDNDNYGVNRILLALQQRGIDVSRRTVYRVMKEKGLLHKRHRPHGITKATTEVQEQENLIKRNFDSEQPMRKLLTAHIYSFMFTITTRNVCVYSFPTTKPTHTMHSHTADLTLS